MAVRRDRGVARVVPIEKHARPCARHTPRRHHRRDRRVEGRDTAIVAALQARVGLDGLAVTISRDLELAEVVAVEVERGLPR